MATRVVLLVFGYVRKKCVSKQIVPISILHIIKQFYDAEIVWKFPAKLLKTYEKESALGPAISFRGIPLQFAVLSFLLVGDDPQYRTREYKKYLVLFMNPEDINQNNIIHFILLVSVNNNEYKAQIAYNTVDITMDSKYDPKEKYWIIQKNIDNNLYDMNDIHNDTEERMTLSVDLLEMKYFKMNVINNIKWYGMNTKRGEFEDDIFDIYWDEIDRKILMNFKLKEMPCKVLALCFRFQFISIHDKILCEDEKALRKDNHGNILYTKLKWKGKKLMNADRLVITVTKVFDVSVREVPKNEWINYGFAMAT